MKYVFLLGIAMMIINAEALSQGRDQPCLCSDGREGYQKTSVFDSYVFGGSGKLICICDYDSYRYR